MEVILNGLSKRFSENFVLRNIDIHFESGKCYGIKGPNGSGKSTLLKMISGYLSHTRGSIDYRYNNQNVQRGEIANFVSFAAPYIDLIEDFNLIESLDFHQKFRKFDTNYSLKEFRDVLAYKKIKTDQYIKFYSSGMKKRLQLCLAILTDAKILLLDEPTSYLDDEGILWFQKLLSNHKKNKTVIIASNDEKDFTNCDDIISIIPWMAG